MNTEAQRRCPQIFRGANEATEVSEALPACKVAGLGGDRLPDMGPALREPWVWPRKAVQQAEAGDKARTQTGEVAASV